MLMRHVPRFLSASRAAHTRCMRHQRSRSGVGQHQCGVGQARPWYTAKVWALAFSPRRATTLWSKPSRRGLQLHIIAITYHRRVTGLVYATSHGTCSAMDIQITHTANDTAPYCSWYRSHTHTAPYCTHSQEYGPLLLLVQADFVGALVNLPTP